MKHIKEWLSDYLRYLLLLLAAILAFFLIMAGIRIWQNTRGAGSRPAIQILTGQESETSEAQTETQQESETPEAQTETEQESETAEAQTETKQEGETPEAQPQSDQKNEAQGNQTESGAQDEQPQSDQKSGTSDTQAESDQKSEAQTERETERVTPQTEAQTEYTPVYKTLQGSCYIRSGPSMEAEIIGEYMYGTTVEFLEDVGGWYKVRIDGMVGYMGARFF